MFISPIILPQKVATGWKILIIYSDALFLSIVLDGFLWQYEDKDQRTDQKKSRIKQLWKNLKSGEIVSKFICR